MNGGRTDMSTASYKQLEMLNKKFRAIHRLRGIIFRNKKGSWKLEELCQNMTKKGAYQAAWIALAGPKGLVKEFAESGMRGFLDAGFLEGIDRSGPQFTSSLKKLFKTGENTLVNRDPVYLAAHGDGRETPAGVTSITHRIEYKARFYGVISVFFPSGVIPLEDEALILFEVANDIAYAMHDMEAESKRRELRDIINSLEARHRTVFENTGTATCVFEESTVISLANRDFERLSGFSKDEIEGKMSWTTFIEREDIDRMVEYHRLRRIDPAAAPRNYYFRFIDRYRNLRDIYMTISLIPNTKKSIASFMDITEQKRLEAEILKISEKERREIGNNLHDGLGPHLVGVKFMLNLLKQKLQHRGVSEASDIDEINTLIDQAVSQTRLLVKGLCPVDIDPEGLVFALRELAENIERVYGIACSLTYDDTILVEDNTSATQLYYIAQEAINNAIKHARAKRIEVSFVRTGSSTVLSVKDDGIGIEMLDNARGMGINIMRYRARLINSLLDVIRNDGGGTSVICFLRQNSRTERRNDGRQR